MNRDHAHHVVKKILNKVFVFVAIFSQYCFSTGSMTVPLNLETAVQGNKVMQDFELESPPMGVDHSQKVKATPIGSDYSSKDCINLLPSTAVSRLNEGPDFLILGATKCGTTSLYRYLKEHPNIQLTKPKELHFFDKNWSKSTYNNGIDWYLEQFPKKHLEDDFFLVGEATPGYLVGADPREVSGYFPKAKLIILVRNPINRALSHYKMLFRRNVLGDQPPLEELFIQKMTEYKNTSTPQPDPCIYNGIYTPHIKAWREFYPDNQIFIICSEELFASPCKVVNDVFTFLGLSAFDLKEYKIFNKGSNNEITLSPDLRRQMSEFYAPYNQELQVFLRDEMHLNFDLASFGWNVNSETDLKD